MKSTQAERSKSHFHEMTGNRLIGTNISITTHQILVKFSEIIFFIVIFLINKISFCRFTCTLRRSGFPLSVPLVIEYLGMLYYEFIKEEWYARFCEVLVSVSEFLTEAVVLEELIEQNKKAMIFYQLGKINTLPLPLKLNELCGMNNLFCDSLHTGIVSPLLKVHKPPAHISPDLKENSQSDSSNKIKFNFLNQNNARIEQNTGDFREIGDGNRPSSQLAVKEEVGKSNLKNLLTEENSLSVLPNAGSEIELKKLLKIQKMVKMQSNQNLAENDPRKLAGSILPSAGDIQVATNVLQKSAMLDSSTEATEDTSELTGSAASETVQQGTIISENGTAGTGMQVDTSNVSDSTVSLSSAASIASLAGQLSTSSISAVASNVNSSLIETSNNFNTSVVVAGSIPNSLPSTLPSSNSSISGVNNLNTTQPPSPEVLGNTDNEELQNSQNVSASNTPNQNMISESQNNNESSSAVEIVSNIPDLTLQNSQNVSALNTPNQNISSESQNNNESSSAVEIVSNMPDLTLQNSQNVSALNTPNQNISSESQNNNESSSAVEIVSNMPDLALQNSQNVSPSNTPNQNMFSESQNNNASSSAVEIVSNMPDLALQNSQNVSPSNTPNQNMFSESQNNNASSSAVEIVSNMPDLALQNSQNVSPSNTPNQNMFSESQNNNASSSAVEIVSSMPDLTPPNVVIVIKRCKKSNSVGDTLKKNEMNVISRGDEPRERPIDSDPKIVKRSDFSIIRVSGPMSLRDILFKHLSMFSTGEGISKTNDDSAATMFSGRRLLSTQEDVSNYEMISDSDNSGLNEENTREKSDQNTFQFRNQQINFNDNWKQNLPMEELKNKLQMNEDQSEGSLQNSFENVISNKQDSIPPNFGNSLAFQPHLDQIEQHQIQNPAFRNHGPIQDGLHKVYKNPVDNGANLPKVDQLYQHISPMQGHLSIENNNRESGEIKIQDGVKNNPDDSDWNDFSKYRDPSHVNVGEENPNNPTAINEQYGQGFPQNNQPINQRLQFPNINIDSNSDLLTKNNQINGFNGHQVPPNDGRINPTFWNPLLGSKNSEQIRGNSISNAQGQNLQQDQKDQVNNNPVMSNSNNQVPNNGFNSDNLQRISYENLAETTGSPEENQRYNQNHIYPKSQKQEAVQIFGVWNTVDAQEKNKNVGSQGQGAEGSGKYAVSSELPFQIVSNNQPQNDGSLTQNDQNLPFRKQQGNYLEEENGHNMNTGAVGSASGFEKAPMETAPHNLKSETVPEVEQKDSKHYKISSIVNAIKNSYIDPMRKDRLEDLPIKNEWGNRVMSASMSQTPMILLHIFLLIVIAFFV
ncbi:hypothetical protein GQR58_004853 [Nymphon striatum]|nr:hypothetical protein GQR58_004853 [Nymphon striatum]